MCVRVIAFCHLQQKDFTQQMALQYIYDLNFFAQFQICIVHQQYIKIASRLAGLLQNQSTKECSLHLKTMKFVSSGYELLLQRPTINIIINNEDSLHTSSSMNASIHVRKI